MTMRVLLPLALAAGLASSMPAAASACERQGDGICDEPYIGTGLCPLNGDTPDCAAAQLWYGSDLEPIEAGGLFERAPAFLRLARNEIFARHGYLFQGADLVAFFSQRSWYRPGDAEVRLSPVETANVAAIKAEEDGQAAGRPHASGLPRPRAAFVAVAAFADGTQLEVENLNGTERQRLSGGPTGQVGERLVFADSREIWDLRQADGMVVLYSAWYDPNIVLRQPAMLAALDPVFESEETVGGERALRFRLDWQDDAGERLWRGFVWVTPDGIVLKGEADFRAYDGDLLYDGSVRFELRGLQRKAIDPSRFEKPDDLQVTYAG